VSKKELSDSERGYLARISPETIMTTDAVWKSPRLKVVALDSSSGTRAGEHEWSSCSKMRERRYKNIIGRSAENTSPTPRVRPTRNGVRTMLSPTAVERAKLRIAETPSSGTSQQQSTEVHAAHTTANTDCNPTK
jgi:hypothetical protein